MFYIYGGWDRHCCKRFTNVNSSRGRYTYDSPCTGEEKRQKWIEQRASAHQPARARARIWRPVFWLCSVCSLPPLCVNEILPADCLARTHAIDVTYYFYFAFSYHFILTSVWERWFSKDANYPRIVITRSRGKSRFFQVGVGLKSPSAWTSPEQETNVQKPSLLHICFYFSVYQPAVSWQDFAIFSSPGDLQGIKGRENKEALLANFSFSFLKTEDKLWLDTMRLVEKADSCTSLLSAGEGKAGFPSAQRCRWSPSPRVRMVVCEGETSW